nr:hypothetical protein CFP56_73829 [Quercus suber]
MEPAVEDLQQPDEFRAAKRVRLDAPLHVTEDVQEEIVDDGDDWNDIYGRPDNDAQPQIEDDAVNDSDANVLKSNAQSSSKLDRNPSEHTIPAPATPATVPNSTLDLAPAGERASDQDVPDQEEKTRPDEDGIPAEALDNGNDLINEQHHVSPTEAPAVRMVEEISAINENESPILDGLESAINQHETSVHSKLQQQQQQANSQSQSVEMTNHDTKPRIKATEDPEFMAAAEAQRESKAAEWQFDSSDGQSSSDSDSDSESDSTDSDDESEGGYEMLDPATAAKMLMQGDGDDDDGDKGKKE